MSGRRRPMIRIGDLLPDAARGLGLGVPCRPPTPGAPQTTRDPDLAVRLQMKLGVIAESDRASDSPDTVVIVEPTIGAIARSKGHLYLIVTSTIASARAQE